MVIELALRIGIALAAGAFMRMLQVFGVPLVVTLAGLALTGGGLSWGLKNPRILVAMAVTFGHIVTTMNTDVLRPPIGDNPSFLEIVLSASATFLPLALPAMGSIIALRLEDRRVRAAKELEEVTVDKLEAEPLPHLKEPSYRPPDLEDVVRAEFGSEPH